MQSILTLLKCINHLLTGNMPALMDIWFIGDAFLQDVFATMQTMKSTAAMDKQSPPYVYEQYNVFVFFTAQTSHQINFLARVQNAMMEAFNRRFHLPRYIVIMLDKDLIEVVNYFKYGESMILDKAIQWLSKELDRTIESRSEDLMQKKPGAAYSNTKTVWTKMIPRKNMQQVSATERKILAAKPKFNAILDDIAHKQRNNHVMNIISLENQHYDRFGRLTYQGKT